MSIGIFRNIAIFALGFFLIIILSGAFLYKSEFSYIIYGDTPVLLKQDPINITVGVIITAFIVTIFWRITKGYHLKNFLRDGWWLIIIFIVFQIAVIYFFRINLTADWEVIYNIANDVLQGNLEALEKGGYLHAYPNNLGLTFYFSFLNLISKDNLYLPRILNIAFSVITLIYLNKLFIKINPTYIKHQTRFFFAKYIFPASNVYEQLGLQRSCVNCFFSIGDILCSSIQKN